MQLTNTLERVRHAAVDACSSAAHAGREVVDRGLKISRQAMDRGLQLVRRNPRSSFYGVLALGALAAWALFHSPARPTTRRARR